MYIGFNSTDTMDVRYLCLKSIKLKAENHTFFSSLFLVVGVDV